MKKIKIILVILIVFIIVSLVLIFNNTEIINRIIGNSKKENVFELLGEVKDSDSEYIYVLVVAQDIENGIKQLITPDGLQVNAYGKTKIAIDYKMVVGKDYKFEALNEKGDKIEKIIRYDYSDIGLLDVIKDINNSSYLSCKIGGKNDKVIYEEEEYNLNAIVYNGDLELDGQNEVEGATLVNNVYEFGNKDTDVATATKYAQNTVVLKVNGNLTIDDGVTVTACKSDYGYGGPKGLIIYCTGTITNNGTISMSERGARAEGQDIFLWKNINENFEYVPAIGAAGGAAVDTGTATMLNGRTPGQADLRKTGGGGSGGARRFDYTTVNSWQRAISGAGSTGTSYSGGTGGGGGYYGRVGGTGQTNGRAGGYGGSDYSNQGILGGSGGGAGNPGGRRC